MTQILYGQKNFFQHFDPETILETNKDPGLNVRELHAQGVDGRGVSVEIIDQPLPTEHVEIVGSLVHYEEIIDFEGYASLHGALVSSIMVGKTVGVAPCSRLFYFASYPINENDKISYLPLAKAVDRILEINQVLPEGDRIRVISISMGFSHEVEGYTEIMDSIGRAEDENILVLYTSMEQNTACSFIGLERDPRSDPNINTEYKLPSWWGKPTNDTIDEQIKKLLKRLFVSQWDHELMLVSPVKVITVLAGTLDIVWSFLTYRAYMRSLSKRNRPLRQINFGRWH